ncbi:hypothetical protein B23_2093 [Geobacillus thermoleovorans B23]|nr:hypothetical protein B23_2093 [Geobacillus thermoleovorans B23]
MVPSFLPFEAAYGKIKRKPPLFSHCIGGMIR